MNNEQLDPIENTSEFKELVEVQERTGIQIKSFTLSSGEKPTEQQVMKSLATLTQAYSDDKKGLPTKFQFTEIFIPEESLFERIKFQTYRLFKFLF